MSGPQGTTDVKSGKEQAVGRKKAVTSCSGEFDVVKDEDFFKEDDLKLAEVKSGVDDRLREKVEKYRAKRSVVHDFFTSIFRSVMNACHAIKCLFIPKYNAGTVSDAQDKGDARRKGGMVEFTPIALVELTEPTQKEREEAKVDLFQLDTVNLRQRRYDDLKNEAINPRTFDNDLVGKALGLKGVLTEKVFKAYQTDSTAPDRPPRSLKELCPNGYPRLDDIKQDPSFQDCWFLSSIGALLHAQGPQSIERLITFPKDQTETPPVAHVRMGHHIYKVPLAELHGDGGSSPSVSKSAPWVKLLERAMQMHLIQLFKEKNDYLGKYQLAMPYHSADLGIVSLMGGEYGMDTRTQAFLAVKPSLEDVKTFMDNHKPVVLGHKPITNGISPDHAVTLIDIDEANNIITVLDPYGHTTNVPADELGDFTVSTYDVSKLM